MASIESDLNDYFVCVEKRPIQIRKICVFLVWLGKWKIVCFLIEPKFLSNFPEKSLNFSCELFLIKFLVRVYNTFKSYLGVSVGKQTIFVKLPISSKQDL